MSVKEFDKTFGLIASIEEEQSRFVNRIENSVFYYFEQIPDSTNFGYKSLFT